MASQQCTATLTYNDGTDEDVTNTASWSSSDTDVATVSDGLVTSVGEGSCVITAEHSGLSGTADVTVTAPEPEAQALAISPSDISLEHEE